MFDDPNETDYIRRDAVSDFIEELKQYGFQPSPKERELLPKKIFSTMSMVFCIQADYRETFASDLKKIKLPKLPLVEEVKDFWAFSKAGRQLAELHLNYESVPAYKKVQ